MTWTGLAPYERRSHCFALIFQKLSSTGKIYFWCNSFGFSDATNIQQHKGIWNDSRLSFLPKNDVQNFIHPENTPEFFSAMRENSPIELIPELFNYSRENENASRRY